MPAASEMCDVGEPPRHHEIQRSDMRVDVSSEPIRCRLRLRNSLIASVHNSGEESQMASAARRSRWARFEASLAMALAVLDDGEALVIRRKGTNRYVRFTAEDEGAMRIESVSNSYLDPEERLTLKECAAMVALGWRPPTISPVQGALYRATHDSPNFYLDLGAPVPVLSIAWMAVATLRHVHGAVTPDDLEYQSFDRSEATMEMPELRVAWRSAPGRELRELLLRTH